MKLSLQLLLTSGLVLGSAYVFSVSASEHLNIATVKPAELTVVSARNSTVSSNDNLLLKASIPGKLSVNYKRINWEVIQQGKVIKKLGGNNIPLHMPNGLYLIRMKIGQFVDEKEVWVNDSKLIKPYFRAEVGSMNLVANQTVDWIVTGPGKDNYHFTARHQLDELVPAGKYVVKAMIRDIPIQREIQVKAGQRVKRSITVPVGKVKLIATRDNQPLFQAMEWKVFRLENSGKRQVGSYRLHSQGITMAPGHYEAVAIHHDKVRKRQFWVQKNTTNKVIIGMD